MGEVFVITSGKGGVGKTTSTANIGAGLAAADKKTVLIDTDIGLRNLDVVMGLENRIVYHLVDIIEGGCRIKQALIRDRRYPNLFLLPSAQTRDKTSVSPEQMKKLIEQLRDDFDYILIDSRAGFHDMAGVVTAQIPHGIVLFGKDSFQSWFGIQQAVRTIAASQADKPFAIMVDSACGVNGIVSEEEKERFRKKSYEVFCSDYYDNDMQPGIRASREAHDPVFVRYTPALSGDIPLYDENRAEDLKTQLSDQPYREIAERIMERFGETQEGEAENSGQDSFA